MLLRLLYHIRYEKPRAPRTAPPKAIDTGGPRAAAAEDSVGSGDALVRTVVWTTLVVTVVVCSAASLVVAVLVLPLPSLVVSVLVLVLVMVPVTPARASVVVKVPASLVYVDTRSDTRVEVGPPGKTKAL